MIRGEPIISLVLLMTACTSPVKLEHVAGTWTCPRVDGVCATTTSIDAGLTEESTGEDAAPVVFSGQPSGGVAGAPAPARTADQVARIVLAPRVDASGHYHEARVIYAVMTSGRWVPAEPQAHEEDGQ
ncbi:MAG: TraV family lipoprotein [Pseudomonadota bacterium]